MIFHRIRSNKYKYATKFSFYLAAICPVIITIGVIILPLHDGSPYQWQWALFIAIPFSVLCFTFLSAGIFLIGLKALLVKSGRWDKKV